MANIQPRKNKDGKIISYSIRVHKGRDPISGKQLKPYTMTWEVPQGWGEKTAEKEARKQAAIRDISVLLCLFTVNTVEFHLIS